MIKERESGSWNASRERRRYDRFAARLPVVSRRDDLSKRGQAAQTAQCRLQLRDFSLGGIRAESAIALKRNERLTMRLPPDSSHPPLELTGRVIHCRRQEDRYQVGIEFCQTRPEATASPWHRMFRLFTMAFEPLASGLTVGRIQDA
jgi:c-di-GMP-binding flagellar brake protein YcgR